MENISNICCETSLPTKLCTWDVVTSFVQIAIRDS